MTACSRWQGALVDKVHQDVSNPSEQQAFEQHLTGCPGCSAELAAQTRFIEELVLPHRPAAGDLNAWQAIESQIAKPTARPWWVNLLASFSPGVAAGGAVAMAMLVIGIGIGRLQVAPPTLTQQPVAAAPVAPNTSADDYVAFLERSAPMLLAITNRQTGAVSSAGYSTSLTDADTSEQQAAAMLADQAARLAARLAQDDRHREANLVRELELVFLQIANLSHPSEREGLELLQAAISDRALLFQLTVEELRHLPASRPEDA